MVQLNTQNRSSVEAQNKATQAHPDSEAQKQLDRFSKAADEAERRGVRGTQADKRFEYLKELQEEASFSVRHSRAQGTERFDLLHERVNAL